MTVSGQPDLRFRHQSSEAVSPALNQNLVSTISPPNVLLGPPNLVAVDPTGVPTDYNYQFSVQYRLRRR